MDDARRGELTRRGVFGLLGAAAGAAVGADAVAAAPPQRAAPSPVARAEQPVPLEPPEGPFPDAALATPEPATETERRRGDSRVLTGNTRGPGLLAAQVDQWVLNAQQWVNRTYGGRPGFQPAPENGRTGWATMFALTRALQLELGLSGSQLSDNFGPTTLSLLTDNVGNVGPDSPRNIILIVQCGL